MDTDSVAIKSINTGEYINVIILQHIIKLNYPLFQNTSMKKTQLRRRFFFSHTAYGTMGLTLL